MGIKIEFLEHQEKQEKASPSEVRAFRREDFRAVAFEARLQDLSKQLPNLNGELEVTTREGSPAACDPAAGACGKGSSGKGIATSPEGVSARWISRST